MSENSKYYLEWKADCIDLSIMLAILPGIVGKHDTDALLLSFIVDYGSYFTHWLRKPWI